MTANRRIRCTLGRALMGLTLGLIAWSGARANVHPTALYFEHEEAATLSPTVELHCLALNIYHEARNEPDEGKFAVAQVTLNRVRSARFPDTVCDVVWQRSQFSWTSDGRPDRPYNEESWDEALWIATIAFEFTPPSVVGDATHYHADYVAPYWAKKKRRVRSIGRHVFYESNDA